MRLHSPQVQTGIIINYCFCFYLFDRKDKSLNYAKATLVECSFMN